MPADRDTGDTESPPITTRLVEYLLIPIGARLRNPTLRKRLVLLTVLVIVVIAEPARAQVSIGSVYCGTTVENGIDVVFSAVAGLGLPATMFYMIRGGVSYMRAGHRPKMKDEARDQFTMAAIGFGIIVLALAAPGIISKFGSQLGFSFSECVRPF